jgi:hypothetical protein
MVNIEASPNEVMEDLVASRTKSIQLKRHTLLAFHTQFERFGQRDCAHDPNDCIYDADQSHGGKQPGLWWPWQEVLKPFCQREHNEGSRNHNRPQDGVLDQLVAYFSSRLAGRTSWPTT